MPNGVVEIILTHPNGRTDLVSYHAQDEEPTYGLVGPNLDRKTLLMLAMGIIEDFATEEEMEELGIYL